MGLCLFFCQIERDSVRKVRDSVTRKNRQMSIKVAKNDFTSKMIDFNTFTKMPKNVGDLDKLIVAKGFKELPKDQ